MSNNNKYRVLLVFGTRPEAIKMAPLVKEFQKYPEQFETIVCVTGQHREMLDQVLNLFEIVPEYDLQIMKSGQDLYDVTSRVLMGMRDVLKVSNPDLVLVHGDTTTSSTTALAAYYQQIPIAHIEAGLRTNNLYSPWPEEANRQITGRLAQWHFAPTIMAQKNLMDEGISKNRIVVTGNTVIDALQLTLTKIHRSSKVVMDIVNVLQSKGIPTRLVAEWVYRTRKMVLITGHRRENFGKGFLNICESIKFLAEKYPDVDFVYPVHLNPNVQKPVYDILGQDPALEGGTNNNIFLIDPIDYLPFVYLMDLSYLILTDSGGIQEEAPFLGKPVLVMRDTTERPEALTAGTVKLVGTDSHKIIESVDLLFREEVSYRKMAQAINPYGDGKACIRIVQELKKASSIRERIVA
ncbi:non-hydrolyzing UDP-N-acetylglucosamine 2-epimerase [Marinifilum caeruleilacunae]|uniref:UDP-N-acetylglucosamine 2-epimerase (non-hydrolyzing) n=1 Tax=Marinifilum caeruleilacunae TaxID=2499076 RepID=A0ABX1WTK9_9BACT|nr:UDP-N-acetylglucosamine 2-epimerase (non-hydrolyzing) [Marinifilum caeruleilacunae]NOU59270.1 UDP-N-acetylglucosamine 2-epimerase (non-hydrolyzing) [Marinifilum caeruleilacunae]